MKLIIDISEDVYTRLFDNGIQDNEIAIDDICEMTRALRMGTPLSEELEKIIKEIQTVQDQMADEEDWGRYYGMGWSVHIIDEHIKELRGE